jgi:hypothetical protein
MDRYQDRLLPVEQIASEFGCSVANVRKWVRDWKIGRGKATQKLGLVPAWNVGLTKETDERMAQLAQARTGEGNPMAGRIAWNAGLTKDVDSRIAQIATKVRGRTVSVETRAKMAAAKRGKTGEQANRWKGGVWRDHVYLATLKGGRRTYLHRHIAETLLCRKLLPDEQVHHIDRNHLNNRPDNLMALFNDDHTYLHRAIERGECLTKEEQIIWLRASGASFELVQ